MESTKSAVFAGGCFWGMEELFRVLPGVVDTEVGYTGGENANPTYTHHPGHAEAIQVVYDPKITTYERLLDFFFQIHDPTTLNRQGNDVGTAYRSAIFYSDDEEKKSAEAFIKIVHASGRWSRPVATSLEQFTTFYPAERYHQDYLQKDPSGYTCHVRRFGSYLSS